MTERDDFFSINNEAEYIRRTQKRLRDLGKADTRIPAVYVDGIYGPETENAVREYQKLRKLPVTGELDAVTYVDIYEEHRALGSVIEPLGYKADFGSYEGGVMSDGDVFDDIYLLQLLLRRLSVKDDRFFVQMTGVYDAETGNAVTLLREVSGKGAEKNVDVALWNDLIRLTETLEGYV